MKRKTTKQDKNKVDKGKKQNKKQINKKKKNSNNEKKALCTCKLNLVHTSKFQLVPSTGQWNNYWSESVVIFPANTFQLNCHSQKLWTNEPRKFNANTINRNVHFFNNRNAKIFL